MLQVLITNKDASQIQVSIGKGGVIAGGWQSPSAVSPSVNGQRYDVSVYVKNTGPSNLIVTSSIPNSPSVSVLPNSKWTRAKFTVIGDGATNLTLVFSDGTPNIPFIFFAALPKINRSNVATENLLPTSSFDFTTGWSQFGAGPFTAAITTNQARTFDYTQYVAPGLSISDKLNQPATCQFTLTNNDDTFVIPNREAYVQVFSNQYNKFVFTGFIANDISKDFVGLNSTTPSFKFQTYRFIVKVTGDEYLLGQKAVPILPPMVNMGAGQILGYLANVLAPGFFDVTSKCVSGDLVPYMEYDPNKNWIQTAKTLADQFRYRVKILNKVLYYQPWGDQTFPITYDDTLNERNFDPSVLNTTIYDTPLVNDAFVLGDAEASDNHEDYFVGDGFTSNFPFRYTAFETDSALLLKEDWSQNSIDTSKWFLQDPVNTVSLVGALNINGGTNRFGETYQYLRSGIDLGSNIILEHGEYFFVGNCSGAIIGGVYDNASTFAEVNGSGQCECGFDIRPASGSIVTSSVSGTAGLQIQPRRLGQLFGTPVITQQNHYYILRTIINGKSNNRYTSTFKSFTGAIISGGTNNAVADITWVISDINLNNTNPNQPGFVNTQPPITDTRFTLRGQTVPAFGLYVLYNVKNANLTIQWTNVFDPPKGSLSAAGLSGVSGGQLPLLPTKVGVPLDYELGFGLGRQVATVGNSQTGGGGGAADGTGSVLQFYSDSIPGVGSRIRYQGWESQTAIARVQDPVSIAKEAAIVGDDGHRMTLITDFKPLPRSSEECELAGKATLLDRTSTIYQGSYGPIRDIFFDFIHNDYPRPGEFFTINSPQRNINFLQVVASAIQIVYIEMFSEQANITISFGPTLFAENLLATFVPKPDNTLMPKDTAVQPTPIQLANVGSAFAGDLEIASLTTAQNLLLFSEQLDNPLWVQTLIGAGTNATITPNSAIDPFGNLTADKIAFPAFGTSSDGCRINQKVSIPVPVVGSFYTFSLWLRADSNTVARIYMKKDNATGTPVGPVTTQNITTKWQRFSISADASSSNTTVLTVVIDGFGPNSAITVYAWGAQLELGQSPTGYFKTISTSGFVPGLGFNGTNAYFDLGADPVTGVEVRRTNFGWGQNNNDRLGIFVNRVFTMPRTQFDQTWYLRQINGPLISRRSKVIRVLAPIIPSAPTATVDVSNSNFPVVSVNFAGDIRNIFGIEIRLADNVTIAPLKSGSSFVPTAGSQNTAQRIFTTPTDLIFTIDNTIVKAVTPTYFIYFFNVMWEYSQPFELSQGVNNVLSTTAFGSELIQNPGFEVNSLSYHSLLGSPDNLSTSPANNLVSDDWWAKQAIGSTNWIVGTDNVNPRTGQFCGMIRLKQGLSIPNGGPGSSFNVELMYPCLDNVTFVPGTGNTGGAVPQFAMPCRGGDLYYFGGYLRWDSTASLPAGVAGSIFFVINFYQSDGTFITNTATSFITAPTSSLYAYLDGWATVLSNAAFMTFGVFAQLSNGSAGTFNTTTNNYMDIRVDDTFIYKANRGSHGTYRPLSNPLTGHDAGSTATVNIASFTMRSGGTDLSISSGAITLLSYNTLYYIYYDDPAFTGGGVVFQASTIKEVALLGENRFFVGSIITPFAGAVQDTIGFNDGGSGAQIGDVIRILPLQVEPSPATKTTGNGVIANQNACIAPDFVTSTNLSISGNSGTNEVDFVVRKYPSFNQRFTTLKLKMVSSVPTNSLNGSPTVLAQNPAGSNIFSLGAGVTRALTVDNVTNFNPLQANVTDEPITFTLASGATVTTGTCLIKIYAIYIEGIS